MINEMQILLLAIKEAGAAILALQNENLLVNNKGDNDIVTAGDLAANEILHKHFKKHFPDYGWLSEESVDDLTRMDKKRVFIVDPIDGTREFAKGIPEFAISVAVVELGEPIAACVFNPATNELFHAIKDHGAFLNNTLIKCKTDARNKLSLLASRSEYKRGEWKRFEEQHEVKIVGSIAYKLALVAAGKADATFSLGPKSEWDIAAGVLLMKEAGGFALTQEGKEFVFNNNSVLVNGIVAASNSLKNDIFGLISE